MLGRIEEKWRKMTTEIFNSMVMFKKRKKGKLKTGIMKSRSRNQIIVKEKGKTKYNEEIRKKDD